MPIDLRFNYNLNLILNTGPLSWIQTEALKKQFLHPSGLKEASLFWNLSELSLSWTAHKI